MAKIIKKVVIQIDVIPDGDEVSIKEIAYLFVGAEEYPDLDEKKKMITVSLTPTQETAIINHIKDIVLPQAELAK